MFSQLSKRDLFEKYVCFTITIISIEISIFPIVTRSVTNQLAELNARQEIVEANGGIPLTNRIFQSQVNIGFNVQLESLLFQQRPARTIRRRHSTQMNVEQVQRPIRNRRSSTDIRTYVAPDDLRAVIGNIRQYLSNWTILLHFFFKNKFIVCATMKPTSLK